MNRHEPPVPRTGTGRRWRLVIGASAVIALVGCLPSQCQPGGGSTPAVPGLRFIQAISWTGSLVESFRFEAVPRIPVPDGYSALPALPGAGKLFVDHRHQRLFHVSGPAFGTTTSSATVFLMEPLSGLMQQVGTISIKGDIVTIDPSGRFLVTREPATATDPNAKINVFPVTGGPPLTIGTPVIASMPEGASLVFSPDSNDVFVMSGTTRDTAQGVTGKMNLMRCKFDVGAGAIGVCDAPIAIDMLPFGGPCTGNFACDRQGYNAESMALDPQLRLIYITAVASISHGGSTSFHRETWAVHIAGDRSVVAAGAQKIPRDGGLFAEPHGRFLFVATPTKLESWAIDPSTLALSVGSSGLGEPPRLLQRPMPVDCDDSGNGCLVWSADGLQLFLWDPGSSLYVPNNTPMPVDDKVVDVWLATGATPVRIWPQDVLVGSSEEPRFTAIRIDLLGAIQSRDNMSLVQANYPNTPVAAMAVGSPGVICVAQDEDPFGGTGPWSQSFFLDSQSGTLSRNSLLPTNSGAIAMAVDPAQAGRYDLSGPRLSMADRDDCGSSWTFTASPGGVQPLHMAVDPLGRRVYVLSQIDVKLTTIPINRFRAARALSPFLASTEVQIVPPAGFQVASDLKIDSRGEHLFATIANKNQLVIMTIDANGAVQLPAEVRSTGDWPVAVAVSPDGRNVYVLNARDRTISQFGPAPGFAAVTGAAALPAITVPTTTSPKRRYGFQVASTSNLLYVSDFDANLIEFWGISDTDGSLTLRSQTPFPRPGPMLAVDRRF